MAPRTSKDDFHFCGECPGRSFDALEKLNRHRETWHMRHHTCLLCDSPNGTLIDGDKIRHHLNEVHGIRLIVVCNCCHFVFQTQAEKNIHKEAMKKRGEVGDVTLLAKGKYSPGAMSQEAVLNSKEYLNKIAEIFINSYEIEYDGNPDDSYDWCVQVLRHFIEYNSLNNE